MIERRSVEKKGNLGVTGSWFLINSIDLKRMLDLVGAQDLVGLTDYLVGEVVKLARAGADVCLLASNGRAGRNARDVEGRLVSLGVRVS